MSYIKPHKKGFTIKQAAQYLGVTEMTVRRHIKQGKLNAELVPGVRGQEYRIYDLEVHEKKEKPIQQDDIQMNIVLELTERNSMLSGQLGAALERVRSLESQLRLLEEGKKPWYKRLFTI